MCKKLLIISFIVFYIIGNNIKVYADDIDEEIEDIVIEDLIAEVSSSNTGAVKEPVLNSRSAIIYDRNTKKVMWGKNENTKRAMASTTKIMTAIIVLENANLNDIVTISKKSANTGGSRLKISEGDKISVNDLLYGLMLRSRKRYSSSFSRVCGRKYRRFCKYDE